MFFDDEDEPVFAFACKAGELIEGKGKMFILNDVEVAVFKVKGEIYALNAVCPHQHSAIIHDGFLEKGFVVCPAHGWKFNLKNGKQPDGRRGLDCYAVEIRNGDVFIKAVKKKFSF